MDFGKRSDPLEGPATEHSLVVTAFTKRISGENQLAPGFLGLRDTKRHNDINNNAYPYRINPLNPLDQSYEYAHEGVIDISLSDEFVKFHLESPQFGKVVFSNLEYPSDDSTYIGLDLSIASNRSRLAAGGDLYPHAYKIFPSITPVNYTILPR